MSDKPPNPSPDSASLVKRLAGPSVTKAGLAKDQTEINRIIAEVSKGSKFYENEKRKDKELTERIDKILKERDELMRAADISKIEVDVDRMLVEIEAERDLSQFIVHVDMDAFYANVELMDNPDLDGKPFGVGKGVLTTASYEARKYGVRSGMAGFVAKALCPELIFLPIDMPKYSAMSRRVMAVFQQYDPNMLVAGCDEGYLNITPYCEEHNLSPDECVQKMRAQVKEETNLTASAGIAPTKILAKICSDKNKPNGQFHLPFEREAVTAFMRELPIRKLPGIGKVSERLLDSIGVKTCGDIYEHRAVISVMDKQFGVEYLLRSYLGVTSNVVQPYTREERKSIGAERTFNPLHAEDAILKKLDEVADELENDMERNGWAGKTVTLKYKLDTYEVFTRAKTFDRWITKKEDLFKTGKELLKPELPLSLRLIGLRVTKLKDLKAPEPAQSIKRFFDAQAQGPSPTKKRRISHGDEDDVVEIKEEAAPSYMDQVSLVDDIEATDESKLHIDDDDDCQEIPAIPPEDSSRDTLKPISRGSLKPISKARSEKPISKTPVPSSPKKRALSSNPSPRRRQGSEIAKGKQAQNVLSCPICLKELETDNTGLNAHIDFCLSKGVIMQATAAAPSVSSGVKKPLPKGKKPPSKGGGLSVKSKRT